MDYKGFYNKFIDKEIIFKEELLFDLVNDIGFTEEDAAIIVKYLNNKYSYKEEYIDNVVRKVLGKESSSFKVFLNLLKNKLIISKTLTSVIENSFIKLIEDLTSLTGERLVYKSQFKTIYDVVGRAFMWESPELKELTPDYIKEYFLNNMMEYVSQYPNLTLKLIGIIDDIPLEKEEDFFEDCSLRNNLLINLKRENIKTKEKPA